MATREENIKKVNDALETMSDDELDQVAGGTYNNTAADSRILNKMGFDIEAKSANDLFWDMGGTRQTAAEVNKIFGQYNIYVDQSWGAVDNVYYKNGQQITREAAFKELAKRSGKTLPDINY